MVYKLRILGLPVDRIADIMEVNVETLYKWRATITEFSDAWQKSGEIADAEVAVALHKKARGYEHKATKMVFVKDEDGGRWETIEYVERYAPDTAAAQFILTNKQNSLWKNRREDTLAGGTDNTQRIIVEGGLPEAEEPNA